MIDRLNAALEGRYRIERELGEGGMATVYLAADVKHDRRVAMKVLRPELAAVVGSDRFLAEIRTTANLQHPNILPLFDSGEADGFLFYVMPYVEGASLRDELDREKQLRVDDAVELACKVADALDYAHGKDVVHRDIKPANILLSERGEPLVADFGIALAISQAGAGRITETGLSLGTPYYMSPEQATGDRNIDARSDVYALASVLYEMLAGQPPFAAPTAQAALARILTEPPRQITEVRRTVPTHVAAALDRGLEKLPADRFTSAAEFAAALRNESFRHTRTARRAAGASSGGAGAEGLSTGLTLGTRIGYAAVLVALAAAALAGWLRTPAVDVAPPTRTVLSLDDRVLVATLTERVEVSPDGSRFAFVGMEGNQRVLAVRNAGDASFRTLPGTEGAYDPDFSPDGNWLVYESGEGALSRIRVDGGDPLTLVPGGGSSPNGPQWGEDGFIYFTAEDGIYRVPETGGTPERMVERSEPAEHVRPLPGGGYTATDRNRSSVIYLEPGSDSARTLIEGGVDARYLPTGHLVYATLGGELWAVPFDPDGARLLGTPTPVLSGVAVLSGYYARYSVSNNGTLVYETGRSAALSDTGRGEVSYFDLAGAVERDPVLDKAVQNLRWSPDGVALAFVEPGAGARENEHDLRVYDSELRTTPRTLFADGDAHYPVWSPDGERIVFRTGTSLVMVNADGSEEPRVILERPEEVTPFAWTSGDLVLFWDDATAGLMLADVADPERVSARTYLPSPFPIPWARLSPNEDLVAYMSAETGDLTVSVRSFPEPGRALRVSSGGRAVLPLWAPDGVGLYYFDVEAEFQLVRVDLQRTGAELTVSGRDTVLAAVPRWVFQGGSPDLHPGGSRFVARLTGDLSSTQTEGPELRTLVVTNWFEELRARLGESR